MRGFETLCFFQLAMYFSGLSIKFSNCIKHLNILFSDGEGDAQSLYNTVLTRLFYLWVFKSFKVWFLGQSVITWI